MKKVKLIRVYTDYDYNHNFEEEEEIKKFIAESDTLEVTDEEYELLTNSTVRNQILKEINRDGYRNKLILVEDKTKEIPNLITSAKEILEKVKATEAAEKKKRDALARKAREAAQAKKIEQAKKILKEAGEL